MVVKTVKLSDIITDAGTQARWVTSSTTIEDYAELMNDGHEFPPVLVYRDENGKLYLADGFHRCGAAKRLELEIIRAEVREGSQRDAKLYAIGANAQHGLQRTRSDKRRAVEMALDDDEISQWSNRQIAELCRVNEKTVRNVKKEREARAQVEADDAERKAAKMAAWAAEYPQYAEYATVAAQEKARAIEIYIEKTSDVHLGRMLEAVYRFSPAYWRDEEVIRSLIDEQLGDALNDIPIGDKSWLYSQLRWARSMEGLGRFRGDDIAVALRIEQAYLQRSWVIEALEKDLDAWEAEKAEMDELAELVQGDVELDEQAIEKLRQHRVKQIRKAGGVHNIKMTDNGGIEAFDMYAYHVGDGEAIKQALTTLMELDDTANYRVLVRRS